MRGGPGVVALLLALPALAAPPPEVPADAAFGQDEVQLNWTTTPGADAYDVYRGTIPAVHDHACRVFRTTDTFALLPEEPAPGELFYFLITAVNADGEGPLGDGRPNLAPCVDGDADAVADNLDNCPVITNPTQADQDLNGVGDPCDPYTYDFSSDAIGARPAQMTRVGWSGQTLTVKALASGRGVSYDLGWYAIGDRFDRLDAGMPHQDTTIWIDLDDVPQSFTVEFWSDGIYGDNNGGGVMLEVAPDGRIHCYERHASDYPGPSGPLLPADGRLRLRLVKGAANTSTLHVDRFVGGPEWLEDYVVFPIADDHRYLSRASVLGDLHGGQRPLKRITVRHTIPAATLTLRKDVAWSIDWKVFQRGATNDATIPVRTFVRLASPGKLQARVVPAGGGGALLGHDWTDHQLALGAVDGGEADLDVTAVPAGGNYDVEVRLVRDSDGAVLAEDAVREVGVGDVFLAGGQSNMCGYSGSLAGAEAPTDAVHLFGNDYVWKRASEPMDDPTEQVDMFFIDGATHSLMLRFAKEIQQALGVPVAIIPGPHSQSNIYQDWLRNGAEHEDRATLFGSLLHRARLQMYATPPKGFLWYQGESDAWDARGKALYKQDLQQLMSQWREDLAEPQLWFGIVQLATYDTADFSTWIPIQEAQREVALEDAHAVLAAAVDLQRADAINLNVDGYKTIGMRLAREMLEHAYGQPIDASAQLLQARVTGSDRKIELVYDRAITGGAPSLYRVIENGTTSMEISSVTTSGSVVTLSLVHRINGSVRVSYGYSRSPAASWVRDTAGTAVAVFQDVPAN